MKPFNLDEYLANPNKKLVTRDGRKVTRVLCTDAKGPHPIVALIERYDKTMDNAFQYTKDGRYFNTGTDEKDLFFAPEKKEGWINVYRKGVSGIYDSEEEAKDRANNACATIKIEWEE